MKKTKYAATIYDGHSHIERRIYENENGIRFVKINGLFFELDSLKYEVETFYTGSETLK